MGNGIPERKVIKYKGWVGNSLPPFSFLHLFNKLALVLGVWVFGCGNVFYLSEQKMGRQGRIVSLFLSFLQGTLDKE